MPFSPQGGNGTVLAPSDVVAGSANFEDRENQIRAQRSGFDLERRSRGVSARWLLMQSIKKPSQAMRSLRRRWQTQPILRTGNISYIIPFRCNSIFPFPILLRARSLLYLLGVLFESGKNN